MGDLKMVDYYNITNITSQTTYADMFKATNEAMGGFIVTVMLLIVFFTILLVFTPTYSIRDVMLYDSFLITVISALLWMGGFVSWGALVIPSILLFGCVIWAFTSAANP